MTRASAELVGLMGTAPAHLPTHIPLELYIPGEGRYLGELLREKGAPAFLSELERLAQLGSPWAGAALGFLYLFPDDTGRIDTARARAVCNRAAAAGDGYALYVQAWSLLIDGGRDADALAALRRSCGKLFAPAMLDYAILAWQESGAKSPANYRSILRMLSVAGRAGHKAALAVRCHFYRSGRLGLLRQAVGYCIAPIAAVRLNLARRADPHSMAVFSYFFCDEPEGGVRHRMGC